MIDIPSDSIHPPQSDNPDPAGSLRSMVAPVLDAVHELREHASYESGQADAYSKVLDLFDSPTNPLPHELKDWLIQRRQHCREQSTKSYEQVVQLLEGKK